MVRQQKKHLCTQKKKKNLFTLDWEYGMDKQAICVSVDCFIFRRVP